MIAPVQPRPLLLASASPRRAELLREAGYEFEVAGPSIAEPDWIQPSTAPAPYAESLAFFKASSVSAAYSQKTILAADTIAAVGGAIIGKPADEEDAFRILRLLSGTTHSVITGVALLHAASGHRLLQHCVSTVKVRQLDESLIRQYLATGAWSGKAGAYGIQDRDDPFVESYTGSFTNIVGLPMELLAQMFEHWTTKARPGVAV